MKTETTGSISDQNDAFRETFVGGLVLVTPHVESLKAEVRARVLKAVREFAEFTLGNDPYNEHDFGSVEIDGEAYFWKIDLYDDSYERGSPCPADPSVTRRVLTVMHVHEW